MTDISAAGLGISRKLGEWRYDLEQHVYWQERFRLCYQRNSGSAPMRRPLPMPSFSAQVQCGRKRFSSKHHQFGSWRKFDVLHGLNVAVGAEQRAIKHTITAGEEASYKNQNISAGVTACSSISPASFATCRIAFQQSVAGYLKPRTGYSQGVGDQRRASLYKAVIPVFGNSLT